MPWPAVNRVTAPGGYFTAALLRWRHGDKHLPHGRGTSAQGTTPPYVPQIRLYQQWLHATRGLQFDSYDALWRWSVTDLNAFWQLIWDTICWSPAAPRERRQPGCRGASGLSSR